jgi:hypothetical protein
MSLDKKKDVAVMHYHKVLQDLFLQKLMTPDTHCPATGVHGIKQQRGE